MDVHRCDLQPFHKRPGAAQTKQMVCPQPSREATLHDRTQMKHVKQTQMQPDFVTRVLFRLVSLHDRVSVESPHYVGKLSAGKHKKMAEIRAGRDGGRAIG